MDQKPKLTKSMSSDISDRLTMLERRKKGPNKASEASLKEEKPRRRQSLEISNLMSQLMDKQAGGRFTKEVHLSKDDPRYGKPQEGTRTAARGRQAHNHISKEIVELCEVITAHGQMKGNTDGETGVTGILFGDLFSIYNRISNKVVGLLLRARKYKIVEFDGETLFQGKDDLTPIFLLRSMSEVREVFASGEANQSFVWGKLINNPTEDTKKEELLPDVNNKPPDDEPQVPSTKNNGLKGLTSADLSGNEIDHSSTSAENMSKSQDSEVIIKEGLNGEPQGDVGSLRADAIDDAVTATQTALGQLVQNGDSIVRDKPNVLVEKSTPQSLESHEVNYEERAQDSSTSDKITTSDQVQENSNQLEVESKISNKVENVDHDFMRLPVTQSSERNNSDSEEFYLSSI